MRCNISTGKRLTELLLQSGGLHLVDQVVRAGSQGRDVGQFGRLAGGAGREGDDREDCNGELHGVHPNQKIMSGIEVDGRVL